MGDGFLPPSYSPCQPNHPNHRQCCFNSLRDHIPLKKKMASDAECVMDAFGDRVQGTECKLLGRIIKTLPNFEMAD